MTQIRIATRKSPMAMWQARFVQQSLQEKYPQHEFVLTPFSTLGDEKLTTRLNEIGGKNLFTKELQKALLLNEADIAVHCVKDMSVHDIPGLTIASILKRDSAHDALVSFNHDSLEHLPEAAVIGTASPRRSMQLKQLRPDFQIKLLRGNVNTRLQKLKDNEYDAIILAHCGLQRLGFDDIITEILDTTHFVPAIGQGALAIECRENDTQALAFAHSLHCNTSALCVQAERQFNKILGGDCHTALGVYARISNQALVIDAMLGREDGTNIMKDHITGCVDDSENLATQLAEALLAKGAKDILCT